MKIYKNTITADYKKKKQAQAAYSGGTHTCTHATHAEKKKTHKKITVEAVSVNLDALSQRHKPVLRQRHNELPVFFGGADRRKTSKKKNRLTKHTQNVIHT